MDRKLRRCFIVALFGIMSLATACIPKVQRFERFDLHAGGADVLWVFVNERLNRCVNTPRGPVCVQVNYVQGNAGGNDLAFVPATPPPVAAVPPVPHG